MSSTLDRLQGAVPVPVPDPPRALAPYVRELAGDFETVYRRDYAATVRLAHLLSGSNAIAQELAQEAFAQLYQRWDRALEPRAYVRGILVNLCKVHHRRRAVEGRHLPAPPPPMLPPDLDETWQLLSRLSPKRRIALVLRFYEDLSVEQVAAAMGCRVGTAKSLIHRGLESLRQELT